MVLLILGVGGVLLGLGWTAMDGASRANIKPAWVGLVLFGIGLALPLDGANPPTATPADPPQEPAQAPAKEDLKLAIWPTVSTRLGFACATNLKGEPNCWGTPVAIGDEPVVQFALGRKHGCALHTTGQVACWGTANTENQRLRHHRFTAIAATLETTCGLTQDDGILCWGDMLAAPPQNAQYTSLSGGANHYCALTAAGEAVCWGDNREGQTTALPGPYTAISAGHFHTCGILSDSTAQCWGRDHEGQSSPPNTRFRQISAGWSHTCGITQRGTIACWGCAGKIGTKDAPSACRPPSGAFIAISSGDLWQSCAVNPEGGTTCWGGLPYEEGPQ